MSSQSSLPLAVRFNEKRGYLEILDQRCLPDNTNVLACDSPGEVEEAIKHLAVRGAPAIGVAAAYGLALAARSLTTEGRSGFEEGVKASYQRFLASRPTAVNLQRGLDAVCAASKEKEDVHAAVQAMFAAAEAFARADIVSGEKIASCGRPLIEAGADYMTYCNAGALATANRYGTALAPFYRAFDDGLDFKVYACETRPVGQGARLTATELAARGLDVTLICDNMAGALMADRRIAGIFIGADRIARNGDAANKIGSYTLACLAQTHGVPFYVCAPRTSFDPACPQGKDIPIEERKEEEIRCSPDGKKMVADAAKVWNPAFDVVPAEWITAFVTDFGLQKPPYDFSFKEEA